MKRIRNNNNIDIDVDFNNIDPRVVRRVMRQLARFNDPSCMPQQARADCQTKPCKMPLLLSCETVQQRQAANRTAYYDVSLSNLAAGATSNPALFSTTPATNSLDYFSLQGEARTLYLTDLISTLTNLDSMLVIVSVGGVARITLNGGRFARGNANSSTGACGLWVCAGALETVVVKVYNQSAAAFGATDSARLETRTVWEGEPGYQCATCAPAQCGPCGGAETTTGFDPGEVG